MKFLEENNSRLIVLILTGLSILFSASEVTVRAQGGFVDPNITGTVNGLVVLPDGKILVGGDFASAGGQASRHVARLNSDGTPDVSFQNPDVRNNDVFNEHLYSFARQPDGKIVIGGNFTSVSGQPRNCLARLNADGTVDLGFLPSVNSIVTAVGLQPDGKVLIGGYFTSVSGQTRTRFARLNSDGSIDSSFIDPNLDNWTSTIVVQPDGKILIGGWFSSVAAQPIQFAARLNVDGTVDSSFNLNINGPVIQMALRPDGKFMACGFFGLVNGTTQNVVARINTDGSLDTSFQNPNIPSGNVVALAIQSDGKIVVGGSFSRIGGQDRNDLARLNGDGSFDPSFPDVNANFGGTFFSINSIVVQFDQKILVGGDFDTVGHQTRNNLVRLLSDGTLDLPPAHPFLVTKTTDTNDGTCNADCSLREAVTAANGVPESSIITFDPQIFGSAQTILLSAGELVIEANHRITIQGPGSSLLTISGNNTTRIIRQQRDTFLTVSGVTLTNGNGSGGFISGQGGAIFMEPNGVITRLDVDSVLFSSNHAVAGGAIRSNGQNTVNISNSTFDGNNAMGGSGVIVDGGPMNIAASTFRNHSGSAINIGSMNGVLNLIGSTITGTTGAAIVVGGTAVITDSSIDHNTSTTLGAAISCMGNATLNNSIVTANTSTDTNSDGGGIYNSGRLTINNSTISGNSAAFGGAIYSSGGVTTNGATISGNTATQGGGGIYNNAGGSLPDVLNNSLLINNHSNGFGGGIYNRDTMQLNGTTVQNNSAVGSGGGAFNVFLNVGAASLTAQNSTFSSNTATSTGGGISNQQGTVTLTNSAFSGNSAILGGGIRNNTNGTVNLIHVTVASNRNTGTSAGAGVSVTGAVVNAVNSIVALNILSNNTRSDFGGTLTSGGYNLIGTTAGVTISGTTTGNILNADPALGPLAANGGTTFSHALLAGSPAVDAGDPADTSVQDQRGVIRRSTVTATGLPGRILVRLKQKLYW